MKRHGRPRPRGCSAMDDGPSTRLRTFERWAMRLTSSASWRRRRGSTRRVARWKSLGQINRLRPLIQFDAGSPRVGDECNPDANVVHAVGPVGVELDAGRFQLGDECFQILYIETDVIEDPALRRPFRNT